VNSIVSLPIAAAVPTAAPAMLTAAAPRPDAVADSKLLALVEELIVAEQRYSDLTTALDQMNARVNPPGVLRIRPRDLELGRKPTFESTDEFWHRPCDITQWRNLMEYKTEWKETDDRAEMVQWKIKPSEELRLRGAEVVAAFEEWHDKKPRGYKKAVRELNRAEKVYNRLEAEIYKTPATTIEGMRAKIRCAKAWNRQEIIERISGGCAEAMALSIFNDIQRITDTASS
jgi:hypothetical protein